jgi:hypothetical protein
MANHLRQGSIAPSIKKLSSADQSANEARRYHMNDPSEHCPRIAPIPLCEKRKKMFNTNALHNLLNVSITLSALIVAILLATGCAQLADGTLECSQSFVGPSYTAAAVAALSALKIAVNIMRDGVSGLIKPQPPVDK